MEIIRFNLPQILNGNSFQLGFKNASFYWNYGEKTFYLIINPKLLIIIIGLLTTILFYHLFEPRQIMHIKNIVYKAGTEILDNKNNILIENEDTPVISKKEPNQNGVFGILPIKINHDNENEQKGNDDPIGYFINFFNQNDINEFNRNKTFNEKFLVEKQLLITRYLIQERVARLDQLSNKSILKLSDQISRLFVKHVLDKIDTHSHVYHYFTDTTDLKKLQTAFVEQIKYHVPASITLAQSALETAYGKRVINNNYFGIKDKSKGSKLKITTEYYTSKEVKANRKKILTKEKLKINGKTLYKCKVKDYFINYQSPWKSFREHSVYLSNNKRYAPLFTKGKDYKAWAEKIGSTKYGGVGYATSPLYGQLLKKIIKKYHLDLLDH